MDVKISYSGCDRGTQALLLDELAAALDSDGLNCRTTAAAPNAGEKGDVATGLIIAGLAVQSFGALINALTFYFNGRPNYTVTLKRGDATCTIGNISARDATRMLSEASPTEDVGVEIVEGK